MDFRIAGQHFHQPESPRAGKFPARPIPMNTTIVGSKQRILRKEKIFAKKILRKEKDAKKAKKNIADKFPILHLF